MATWAEFETEAPELAAVAARLWPGITALHHGGLLAEALPQPVFSIAYLATIRPTGAPRLHPFCPILAGGRLFAAIPWNSPKGHDLRRDPRCAVHALPGPDDDELCIRGHAYDVSDDQATRTAVAEVVTASGVGGMIETATHDPLFELQIDRVDVARWLDIGQPGTRAVRHCWQAPEPRTPMSTSSAGPSGVVTRTTCSRGCARTLPSTSTRPAACGRSPATRT